MRKLFVALTLALILVPAGTAKADWEAGAWMTGESVVPPVRTQGWGWLYLYVPRDQSYIYYHLMYGDLQGRPTGAAIHLGPEGRNGPVMFNLTDRPTGTGGVFEGVLTERNFVPGAVRTYEEAVRAILSDRAYSVLRTSAYPRGEVRGPIGLLEE